VQHFPYSLNVYAKESDLRVQIQTDARYFPFVERAQIKNVLGLTLPVASIGDLLAGKIWAFQDTERRASKRQKDLTDIARIVERYPEYEYKIPQEIREHLL